MLNVVYGDNISLFVSSCEAHLNEHFFVAYFIVDMMEDGDHILSPKTSKKLKRKVSVVNAASKGKTFCDISCHMFTLDSHPSADDAELGSTSFHLFCVKMTHNP